jgi:hypothetical protein
MDTNKLKWMTKFEVIFLTEVREFLLRGNVEVRM